MAATKKTTQNAEPIVAPDATIQRLLQYQRAQQVTVDTLAEALDVPSGWRFSYQAMAFVPPAGEDGEK